MEQPFAHNPSTLRHAIDHFLRTDAELGSVPQPTQFSLFFSRQITWQLTIESSVAWQSNVMMNRRRVIYIHQLRGCSAPFNIANRKSCCETMP
eukprot:1148390-Pelagomonas_calceolata.AAC.1